MSLQHKQSCIDSFAAFEKQVEEWERKWSNYCKNCYAVGFSQTPGDRVPYGSTYVNLPDMVDSCSQCAENGWCGRCGEKLFDPEEFDFSIPIVCRFCGWTDNPDVQLNQKELIHPLINSHPTGEGPCECQEEDIELLADEYRQASGEDLEDLLARHSEKEENLSQISYDSFGDMLDRHL